jgi:hypothetical protein
MGFIGWVIAFAIIFYIIDRNKKNKSKKNKDHSDESN